MEVYMKLLLEQIRCKKAHSHIKEEIRGHIEAQIADNMMAGMSKEEAEKAAVKDMGNPVEVGIALDRIHKPRTAWSVIILMALISIAGIILHYIMSSQMGEEAIGSADFGLHTLIGFAFMMIVYHIDYSVIARYSKIIAGACIGICAVALINGDTVGGMVRSFRFLRLDLSLFFVMMLYVPLYGAVLYKYHGLGYKALINAILWMLVPVFIAFYLPSLPLALILLISMSVVLTVAILHDWFKVSKKKVIAILWGCVLGLPTVCTACVLLFDLFETHQTIRIKSFLFGTGSSGANYVTAMLRTILSDSQLVGNSGKELAGNLVDLSSSYIISYVISTYGVLVGVILCCILAVLIVRIFTISFKQKNQLGMCMGCGCGIIILLNVVINIGVNLGLIPTMQTFLPFFSSGGSGIITCYILMGIILSVYRYKNIYPAHTNAKLPLVKITIEKLNVSK